MAEVQCEEARVRTVVVVVVGMEEVGVVVVG